MKKLNFLIHLQILLMKYILFILLLQVYSMLLFAQNSPAQSAVGVPLKGTFSKDSENENGEADPKFIAANFASKKIPTLTSGDKKPIVQMENGVQFIKEVVNELIKEQYSFSLLSQHKYMINGCLGVKASVGEFSIEFNDPEVTVNESGKVLIKLKVDEVRFSALKVRMRPCPKDLQCHFSSRFNIGGLARDLTMRVTMDPMAMVASSTGVCAIAFQGSIPIHWDIKSLNLQPLQNNLDDVAKHIIEDALNGSSLNIFTDRFLKIAKRVFPAYFETCKEMYSVPAEAMDVVKGDSKNNNEKEDKSGNSEDEQQVDKSEEGKSTNEKKENKAADKWVITPTGSKGATGIVSVNLPAGVKWYLLFRTTDNKDIVRHDNVKSHTMMPGVYNIIATHLPVLTVPVQKGMNTRLKMGTLHMVSEGQWSIYSEDKSKIYVTLHYPGKLGLPIGIYQISMNGQYQQVEIKDGEVTEF